METFTFFWDGPFSQWHPCTFRLDGDRYNCAEQFMMAEKARYFMDDDALSAIMRADHPRDQKRIGREISGFDDSEWQHTETNGRPYCWNIVYRGNVAKFSQNPKLLDMLLRTAGTTLVEASPLDSIWGIGVAADDSRAYQRATWQGTNWLGEVLTAVREYFAESDGTVA
ncbi:MAG: NADAR family protein [Planctomycetota bacterium]